ncbi:hypothetical protein [Allorhizocola rhizosphaerae]|uniref:hypothetical protein n=1 Tax=Allorhizocola rhizosphaerae TaxID=1872709 RepID=UPI000E3EB79D|nr:hypothetical protein [Allorhizocola rhizosphaerae]
MHPYDDRSSQENWEADEPPDPTAAQTAGEFLAELEVLLRWSGLPVSEIEHRARIYSGFLPEGAVANTLRGNVLPSEELLMQLLWAVGCDDETVGQWVWARGRLAEIYSVPDKPTGFSEGALATAVKERRNQSGWRGLHRRAAPDDGDDEAKHVPRRARRKEAAGWSSGAMIGLVVAGVLALTAGIAVALSGGDETTTPPPTADGNKACCLDSRAPDSPAAPDVLPSDLSIATPTPKTSSRPPNSPTPTRTTQSPRPSPTRAPELNGSGSTACASEGGSWLVTVTLSATLTGATSGTDPRGQAGSSSVELNGSGGTSFSGQTTINAGPDSASVQGTIQWTVTVTVSGAGTITANGSVGFTCTAVGSTGGVGLRAQLQVRGQPRITVAGQRRVVARPDRLTVADLLRPRGAAV